MKTKNFPFVFWGFLCSNFTPLSTNEIKLFILFTIFFVLEHYQQSFAFSQLIFYFPNEKSTKQRVTNEMDENQCDEPNISDFLQCFCAFFADFFSAFCRILLFYYNFFVFLILFYNFLWHKNTHLTPLLSIYYVFKSLFSCSNKHSKYITLNRIFFR